MLKAFCFSIIALMTVSLFATEKPIVLKHNGTAIQGIIDLGQIRKSFTLNTIIPETYSGNTEIITSNENEIKTKKVVQYFENKCIVYNTVHKTEYGLLWEIEIRGVEGTWSVPIETALTWDKPESIGFWTTWSDNQTMEKADTWQDPFLSSPLSNLKLTYGGENHTSRTAFVIPLASSFFKKDNIGVSFIESPADTILDMELLTSASGKIAYRHIRHRICPSNTIHIKHHIVLHKADWRAGLGWLYENYKSYFNPVNPLVNKIAGCAAYSSYEGELDVKKYKKMAFSVNWKASLDFPYMGMFIPPVKRDDELWEKYRQNDVKIGDGYASIERLNKYSEKFKQMGFYTLSYFNVTEAGNKIIYEYYKPKQKARLQ